MDYMKRLPQIFLIFVLIIIVGCSTKYSEEMYNEEMYYEVMSELEEAHSRIEELDSELSTLQGYYDDLKSAVDWMPETKECERCGYEVELTDIKWNLENI